MVIKKKKGFNNFSIEGLTAGKLMAINAAIQEQKNNGTFSPVGEDVLDVLNQERKNFING